MSSAGFQRARSPHQQRLRRDQILATARELLAQCRPEEVSLRELSAAVGLAKSNVVRYFPTREAVFLAVLAEDLEAWLDDLARRLPGPDARRRTATQHELVASAVVGGLAARPRLCDLLAAAQSVLERNVPADTAREFKSVVLTSLDRLADLVGAAGVDPAVSGEFARYVWVLVAGAWPMARPTAAVAGVLAEPRFASLRVDFVPATTRALTVLLTGLAAPDLARAGAGAAVTTPS